MIDGFVYNDNKELQQDVLRILRMIEPREIRSHKKIRVGGTNDGGYIMLDDFAGVEIAYSLGINNDVAWDLEMASRGLQIFQYDHTIDGLPLENSRFNWFKTGISDKSEVIGPDNFDTLENLIATNGHMAEDNLILKMDIEGSEWPVFANIAPSVLKKFRQIVVEMHGFGHMDQPLFRDRIESSLCNLAIHHQVIHIHANNNAAYSVVGAVPVPAVLELTFVRRDSHDFHPCSETFPTTLDSPCNLSRADYALGKFQF